MANGASDESLVIPITPDLSQVEAALGEINRRVEATGTKASEALTKTMFDPAAAARARIEHEKQAQLIQSAYENITKGPAEALAHPETFGSKLKAALGAGGGVPALLGGILGGPGALGQIGGAAGEVAGTATGIPGGGAIGAIAGKKLAEIIPQTFEAPAKALKQSLSTISESLSGLQQPLGPLSVGFDLAGKAISKVSDSVKSIPVVGEILGPMIDQLAQVPAILKQMLETLTNFAGKASPAAIQQLGMAVDDVQATIGQAFVPVVKLMTSVIRDVGDIIANIIPSGEEVSSALSFLQVGLGDLMAEIKTLATEIGPMIRTFVIVNMQLLSTVLGALAEAARIAIVPIRMLLELLGLAMPEAPARTRQPAARPAQLQGIEEYQRQLQLSAFSQGGEPTQANMPQIVSDMAKNLETVRKILESPWKVSATIAGAAAAAAEEGIKKALGLEDEEDQGPIPNAAKGFLSGLFGT